MSSTQPFETIVFVDIPDPDNILMILHVLAVFKGRVAILLSPRIVDLSAVRYGSRFPEMIKKLGFATMATPITPGKIPKVRKEWEKFFQPDATLSDPKVMEDTQLYVRVSKMRIEECIKKQFPEREGYEIFWDPDSLSKIEEPDMRHAFHAADYAFNFNEDEWKKYCNITEKHADGRPGLRDALRAVIEDYISRQTKEMALISFKPEPTDISDLYEANRKAKDARLSIGGPLTEALQYIQETPKPSKITAMCGTLTDDRSAFMGVQFNLKKDLESASIFFDRIVADKISLDAVPTECCKGKEKDPCPYVLQFGTYKEIMGENALTYQMIKRWGEQTSNKIQLGAFDWITAIAAWKSDIFPWVPVVHEVCQEGSTITNIKFAESKQSSLIRMAKADYEYMEKKRPMLLEEMKKAFPKERTGFRRTWAKMCDLFLSRTRYIR
ncbi:hypothetical protein AA0119_g11463 [Alternaria tenuissima]|uniref:Uncharacterized protein n=2 Tax=Alternaria alternata complex TaxID=187734 RepID=A0A4Q4MZI9_ALTAL|nr:hypothetical protein AA0115_g12024 [Alternaria tenuissima]RYN64931.1 hypothetical protein AA0117_g12346 [Alternaria alternata]RYN89308.1 hypothetical protein AA0119_g11463 [Alternaria tenuissima]RYO05918.1 hypothetical protein AA0121_g12228 [Alternaria tenuissima]RYO48200.1 hypothetical protein AA0116_g12719 [Alternaria tenuissima]